ncbi:MAG: four helix bundle protein [Salibacteraceae bacterium]|jgi:four helix bundle protein
MTHKDLEVWKLSLDLVVSIYDLTKMFPDDEKYGLTSQMRRAAVSIPSNISEGAGRSSTKEFIRFLDIATGSLSELETQLIIVIRLGFIKKQNLLDEEIVIIQKMLFKLKESLKRKL